MGQEGRRVESRGADLRGGQADPYAAPPLSGGVRLVCGGASVCTVTCADRPARKRVEDLEGGVGRANPGGHASLSCILEWDGQGSGASRGLGEEAYAVSDERPVEGRDLPQCGYRRSP
jgi:hypothetical protein